VTREDLPRRFGRYALFDFVGKGGMAEIYLARAETELGGSRLCVVKEILPAFAAQPRFAEMLVFEAKLAAQLSHANIVQVFDLGREAERLYIAMEYVEGYDLNALLRLCTKKRVALPFEFALHIVGEVLRGLDYAHRREDDRGAPMGIVHRDVSPSNVLVSLEGEVKVCDFGIAHANAMVATKDPEWEDALRGKCGYMSPEHARGENIDCRADVFAAGILLWELLAGKRMYRAVDFQSLLALAVRGEPPGLPEKGLPDEARLRTIVMRALASNRDERFESAGAFLDELQIYSEDTGNVASSLRFGEWLKDSFGTDAQRGRLEQAAMLAPGASQQIAALDARVAEAKLIQAMAAAAASPVGAVMLTSERSPRELAPTSFDTPAAGFLGPPESTRSLGVNHLAAAASTPAPAPSSPALAPSSPALASSSPALAPSSRSVAAPNSATTEPNAVARSQEASKSDAERTEPSSEDGPAKKETKPALSRKTTSAPPKASDEAVQQSGLSRALLFAGVVLVLLFGAFWLSTR
jgi:eukaryotic-like serine/threonine-protein kinase